MSLIMCKCKRCGHEWSTHKEKWEGNNLNGYPFQCPKCKSARWRVEKND